jgi:hypothetical protein
MKFKYKYKRGNNIAYKELDGKEIEIEIKQPVFKHYPTRFRLDNGLLIDIETKEQADFLKFLSLTQRILGV